jgi:hypothetical protein
MLPESNPPSLRNPRRNGHPEKQDRPEGCATRPSQSIFGRRLGLERSNMRMCIAWVAFAATISICGNVRAQEMGRLSGILLDPQGAAMAKFPVHLRLNNRPEAGGIVTGKVKSHEQRSRPRSRWLDTATDDAGQFSIEVPPGDWDVFVYGDGFAPICTVVLVESGKTEKIELRFSRYAPMSLQ